MITTTDPRTGVQRSSGIEATPNDEVDSIAERALSASRSIAGLSRQARAAMLDSIADALEADRDALVQTAVTETGLSNARLDGELTRSIVQFRLFGSALRDGGYLEATIDHAGESPLGPVPDVRRLLVPIGPVAVFGSSNFPFAFSVAGGDTASALAAGCPVVLKAHGSHPLTSQRSFDALRAGISAAGVPVDTVGIVFSQAAGSRLVVHPAIAAVGFTGSLNGGTALMDLISGRDEPIPFYGELSSINPLVVTEGAVAERAEEIAEGLFTSYTGSAGQLCTKPGIALVPAGEAGDRLVATLASLTEDAAGQVLLNERIFSSFGQIAARLGSTPGVNLAARGTADQAAGFVVPPTLLTTTASRADAAITEECFGPLIVVVRYSTIEDILSVVGLLPASLTATIHSTGAEVALTARLTEIFAPRCGRIVYNGYPTGVRVSWAQHHGGPWPATNSLHTSVGVSAMRRFLRPFAWQNAPESVLPIELRDGEHSVPRRVDGVLELPGHSTR